MIGDIGGGNGSGGAIVITDMTGGGETRQRHLVIESPQGACRAGSHALESACGPGKLAYLPLCAAASLYAASCIYSYWANVIPSALASP
jgi:hypothetical protein